MAEFTISRLISSACHNQSPHGSASTKVAYWRGLVHIGSFRWAHFGHTRGPQPPLKRYTMGPIIRFIRMLWMSFLTEWNRSPKNGAFPPRNGGNGAGKSQGLEATDLRRAIVYGFRLSGRFCRCDIVPYREEDGGYVCAILPPIGSPPLPARVLQQFAEHVARDYLHKSPDSLGWIYVPSRIRRKTVIPDDVWQIQFIRTGTKGDVQVAWSEAAPEVARA